MRWTALEAEMSKPVAELRGEDEFAGISDVGRPADRRASAAPGRTPGLFWLSGFRSDMTGTKATAVDAFGAAHGLAVTRFDYSGHGQSGGDFNAGHDQPLARRGRGGVRDDRPDRRS